MMLHGVADTSRIRVSNETPAAPQTDVVTKYDVMSVRSIRGLEARTIAKWAKDGWEFVSQETATLQTQLHFRRPKSPFPWKILAIIGGVLAILAVIITIGIALSSGDEEPTTDAPPVATSSPAETVPAETIPAPEPSQEAVAPVQEEILTAENNADLAALLVGPSDGPSVEAFARQYAGRLIEFDGSIGAMAPHGDYDTRYDILLVSGDYSETQSFGGPSFQFRDVNTTSDLNYEGAVPDTIGVGTNVRVVAEVGAFDPMTLLFQLTPVRTQFR